MSAVTTVAITDKENNTVTLPTLSVRRTVAKIAYNIRVADKVPDLNYIPCNCSRYPCGQGFSQRPRLLRPRRRISPMLRSWSFPTLRGAAVRALQYLFENPQGTVSSITDQRDKTPTTPAYASYLMIRATRGSRILDYRIYLGENNTTDFNVGRNTSHTLDITISGDNEVDTRVHGYTLSVTDDFESNRASAVIAYFRSTLRFT